MFKTQLLTALKTHDKITHLGGGSYKLGYNSQTKEVLSTHELEQEIERLFGGVDDYDFRYMRIDHLPYHVIQYTFEKEFVAIRRQSVLYLNKKDNGYSRLIWTNTSKSHLISYETLNCVVKLSNRHTPVMFGTDIDFLDSKNSPVLNTLLFRPVRDLKREAEESPLVHEKSFSYNDVLTSGVKNGRDMLDIKWKRLSKLYTFLNPNKLTFIELLMLRRLQPKLTEKELTKVVQWYLRNKRTLRPTITDYETLYEQYLDHVVGTPTNEFVSDILSLGKETRTPIETNAKSLGGLKNYHDKLVEKLNRKNARKLRKELKIEYDIAQIWLGVDKKLRNSDLNVTVLNSPKKLQQEGIDMGHCVAVYINNVKRGTSYIFHVEYEGNPYTCELTMTPKGRPRIEQLYGFKNSNAPVELEKKIGLLINEPNS